MAGTVRPREEAHRGQRRDPPAGEAHLLGLAEPAGIADILVQLASEENRVTIGRVLSVESGTSIV